MYRPLNYDNINIIESRYFPNSVESYNTLTFDFWARALFQRALSVIKFNLPEDWKGSIRDLFDYCMFTFGFVAVFRRNGAITFQPCNLTGYDWYYRPTTATISNPALNGGSLTLTIGKECEILKLTPDFRGVFDIIYYYAEKLSTLDNAINMSLINNKFAFMLAAKNKAAAEALKKMIDLVNAGQPAVVTDMKVMDDQASKTMPWQIIDRGSLKESYLTTDQLADFRTLLHNFDTEIGIPTLPIEKKERMIDAEANALSIDATSRARVWIRTINESAAEVNKLYSTNISAELSWEEVIDDDESEVDNNRNV